jgi:hypothetical protein
MWQRKLRSWRLMDKQNNAMLKYIDDVKHLKMTANNRMRYLMLASMLVYFETGNTLEDLKNEMQRLKEISPCLKKKLTTTTLDN